MSSGSGKSSTLPTTSQSIDVRTPSGNSSLDQSLNRIKFEHKIDQLMKQSQKDVHQKRMQSLRKELDYINSTAWQFESSGPF